jgi:hypothetical protein
MLYEGDLPLYIVNTLYMYTKTLGILYIYGLSNMLKFLQATCFSFKFSMLFGP